MATRATLAALLALLLIVLSPGIAGWAATPSPSAPAAVPTIVLAPSDRGLVDSGDELTASVVLRADDEAVEPGDLTLAIGDELASSAALADWLESGTGVGETRTLQSRSAPGVEPDAAEAVTIEVAADAADWDDLAPGVYPLAATWTSATASEGASSRSVVVVNDPDSDAAVPQTGLLVPITTGPRADGLIDADELAQLTGEGGRLLALLDGIAGSTAVLAIDPVIPASIRALGTAAPPSATAWLERLERLPNTRFALQFGDADVAAQIGAGLPELLEAPDLSYALSPADFADQPVEQPTTPSPAPTPPAEDEDGDAVELPTTAELLEIPGARASTYWPAAGLAGDAVVAALAEDAVDDDPDAAPLTFLSSEAIEGTPVTAGGTIDGHRILISDAALSAAFAASVAPVDEATDEPRAAALAALSGFVSFAGSAADGEPVLIALDRTAEVSTPGLQAAIGSLYGSSSASPASLDELLAAPAPARVATESPDEARVDALEGLLAGEEQLEAFSAIIDDPNLMLGPERAQILQLIATAWRGVPLEWDDALAAHRDATAATLTAVEIQPPSTIQLVSTESPIPVYVRNALPWPVNVVLVATPDSLRLDVERSIEVRADPGVNTRVQVPVRARVGSGEVDIDLRLLSPTLEQIGPERTVEVHVRAEWERIGIVVLSLLVAGLLGVGVTRTILRRRRARAQTDAGTDAADG
ncbi:DUF6049 family protein [Microbacterium sp. LRZ72]|uniref:DUF6049 family protein n=1 Tax=Microbacterium sp. LRZ72 TaxID=2942481 RepID=UPI0029BF36FA|nr:DUF6049 family protein [Microbacterium sp. LRZ72]MDX2376225.1 DUF6049 family protein [Microbacterium sp. LRZ72]